MIKVQANLNEDGVEEFKFLLGNCEVPKELVDISKMGKDEEFFVIWDIDKSIQDELFSCSWKDLSPNIRLIRMKCGYYNNLQLKVDVLNFSPSNIGEIFYNLEVKYKDWDIGYSASKYISDLREIWISERLNEILTLDIKEDIYGKDDVYGVRIEIQAFIDDANTVMGEKLSEIEHVFSKIHSKILTSSQNSIAITFNFPQELKASCEQYLLYFVRFLKDLGISATPSLKEEAGKILFSVTPTDDVEALDKIREALAVYLNLPSSPISDIEYSENFALMRLQQQVRNLQHSQQMAKTEILSAQYALSLAQQNIDNQDRIIVRQHSVIENL